MNKAEQVLSLYADDIRDKTSTEGCYALAVHTVLELDGMELWNSNDDDDSISLTPSRAFVFDDSSSIYIMRGGVYVIGPNELTKKGTEMNITLNIGLDVSKNYLPAGVAEMQMQYDYVKNALEQTLGAPIYIGLTQSATEEETVVVKYTNVEDVLKKLYWLAWELKQDYIAYKIKEGGTVLGGALVGEYAHEWNYGIFNDEYFLQASMNLKYREGFPF